MLLENYKHFHEQETVMSMYRKFCKFSNFIYFLASISLGIISLSLITYATFKLVYATVYNTLNLQVILNAISYIIISVAVFDISKSFIEEEVIRDKELRSASEARKILTKFSVVTIIALSLEALIFVILVGKDNIKNLVYPCILLFTSALYMIALAIYQKLSTSTEQTINS